MNPPAALYGSMSRDRKPFTYTPGGLDLSEIKSEKMAKRLMRNAMNQGVPEVPTQPAVSPSTQSTPVAVPNYSCLPVQVFPSFSLPANPKSLLRTRSNPDQPKDTPAFAPPPLTYVTNNGSDVPKDVLSKPSLQPSFLPKTTYGSSGITEPVLPELSFDAEFYQVVPRLNEINKRLSLPIMEPEKDKHVYNQNKENNVSVKTQSAPQNAGTTVTVDNLTPIEEIADTIDDQRGVRLVKKVKKEKKVETTEKKIASEENGKPDTEAELTVQLPSKKAGAKVETEVDVKRKLLADGTVEEIKTTTTKTTIDGKTETATKTEKRTLSKEEADAVKKAAKEQEEKNKSKDKIITNGDSNTEAELVVKLPTKKSAAKTETKVEVENKILPDGTVEETKTTTTKTTIDGKTEVKTKVDKRILSKEEAESVIEVEEEEEEVEEIEEAPENEQVNGSKQSEEKSKIIKNEEKSETTTKSTKKVVIVVDDKKDEESDEEVEEEIVEEKETRTKTPLPDEEESVEKDDDNEPEDTRTTINDKKISVESDEEEEEEIVEDKQEHNVEEVEVRQIEVEEEQISARKEESKEEEDEEEQEEEDEEIIEKEETEVKQLESEIEAKETEQKPVDSEEEEEEKEEETVEKPEKLEPEKEDESEYTEEEYESEHEENKPQETPVEKPIEIEIEKEEIKENAEASELQNQEPKSTIKEPSVPLEKVEDLEIKPIGQGTITKTHTEKTEIVVSSDDPLKPLSTQTEFNRYENIVTVNRTTKTLDHAYEQMTQQGIPTVKTYFAPTRDKTSPTPQARPYQPVYTPEPQTERRHSLLLERLSMERQIPTSDIYQNYQNQSYEQQTQWSQEPQSEVLTISNVKPSKITNQEWFQQSKTDNVIYNNITPTTPKPPPAWTKPQTPQPQSKPQPQFQPQTQFQPQSQFQPQPQYQPEPQPPQPQYQYQPSYTENITNDYSKTTTNTYQQSHPSYIPTPSATTKSNQYSFLNKDSSESYQTTSQQFSSTYVPPPWEQDTNYATNNTNQNYYQPPPPASNFAPSQQPWKPTEPLSKFSKPVPTAYIPPAPNQSFVKTTSNVEPPKTPGRKTYYSEYERRYITVPESTYVPGESKFQAQPDPSPKYYYDNNEIAEPVEHQWRKELREFTEKSSQSQTETTSVRPPWEEDPKYGSAPTPSAQFSQTPSWSQTLRPRSWRERSFESEYIGAQDYSKTQTNTLGRGRPVSSYTQNETKLPYAEKVRGVSVDRYNPTSYQAPLAAEHPPVQSHTLTPGTAPPPKGYHNPNVPAYHTRASVEPREQPVTYKQPRTWGESRESPIQSRSFKYLQWITGTDE